MWQSGDRSGAEKLISNNPNIGVETSDGTTRWGREAADFLGGLENSGGREYQHPRSQRKKVPKGGMTGERPPWNNNSIMVIAWSAPDKTVSDPESLNPDEWLGHISTITMDDDTSYSWDGTGGEHYWSQKYKAQSPSSDYTNARSEESAGTGYILDFGLALNAKFQSALKHAYDGMHTWDPYYHNCTYGFDVAFNAIAKDLGINPQSLRRPSTVETFIKNYLAPYTMGKQEFPKR